MKNISIFLTIVINAFFFVSCRNYDESLIIKTLSRYNQIDLHILCKQEYDYLVILDEGTTLEQYNILNVVEQEWLGQKIIFVKNDAIIKQVNLTYYVSEPEKKVYLSFFQESKPGVNYIRKDSDDSIFVLKSTQQIGKNSICYYIQ